MGGREHTLAEEEVLIKQGQTRSNKVRSDQNATTCMQEHI